MPRALAFTVLTVILTPTLAMAQDGDSAFREGRAIVTQHCGVCHTKPNLNASRFGPSLDSNLMKAAPAKDIRDAIANGSPDMPGFKYSLDPNQIDAVVAYIAQTQPREAAVPSGSTGQAPAGMPGGGDN